jgi:NAD(P)-dependent dehydrogenase (short-subunit alcohol dehydrogenase family)
MPPPVALRAPTSPKFVLARGALRANGGGELAQADRAKRTRATASSGRCSTSRYGSPEDLAEVVALLASDRGKWMTGGIINVDGGMTAR